MSILNINLRYIAKRQPDLAQRIKHCEYSDKVEKFRAISGEPGLRVNGHVLNSPFDPRREARRQLLLVDADPFMNVAFLGVGMGYLIAEYLKQEAYRDFILIAEPNLEVLRCWLEEFNISDVLRRTCVLFVSSENPKDCAHILFSKETTIMANGLHGITHAQSGCLYPEYFKAVEYHFNELTMLHSLNSRTRATAWPIYAVNASRNIVAAAGLPGVKEFEGKFAGIPAFIISAGPSLDKNIDQLKRAKGKSVIFAVNTALRPLLEHGIEPDFLVAIDYGPDTWHRHLKDVDTSRMRIIIDSAAHPAVVENFKGQVFYMDTKGRSFMRWSKCIVGERGGVQKGMTVAHSCFLLALEFGCSSVVFVGQDLAFTGGVTHATGTAVCRTADRYFTEDNDKPLTVRGLDGTMLVTNPALRAYHMIFEQMIVRHIDQLLDGCINATEGGAIIEGAKNMMLTTAIDLLCDIDCDVDAIVAAAIKVPTVEKKGRKIAFRSLLSDLGYVARYASEARSTLVEMIEALNMPDRDNLDVLAEIHTRHSNAIKKLELGQRGFFFMHDAMATPRMIQDNAHLKPAYIRGASLAQQIEALRTYVDVFNKMIVAAKFWRIVVRYIQVQIKQKGCVRHGAKAKNRDVAASREPACAVGN